MTRLTLILWLAMGCLVVGLVGPAGALTLTPTELSTLKTGQAIVRVSEAPAPADGQIDAVIDIQAPPSRVWMVLLDCARAPTYMENLKKCSVLQTAPDGSWDVREHQVEWLTLMPLMRSVFRSNYVAEQSIRFQRVEGDLAHLEGEWRLASMAGGTATRLTYRARVGFSAFVPSFMVRDSLRADFPGFLGALKDEVLRREG